MNIYELRRHFLPHWGQRCAKQDLTLRETPALSRGCVVVVERQGLSVAAGFGVVVEVAVVLVAVVETIRKKMNKELEA